MVPATVLTPADLEARRQQPARVPCNGCTACCRHDRVILGPQDDPRAFAWHEEDGYAVLDRKADGSCIYLGEHGCTIHGRAPAICRRFDCRVLVATTPRMHRVIRIIQNPQMAFVYAAGIERSHTLRDSSCHS